MKITPIFILGASRNGTTSLENMLSELPQFANIEHELHHGSHEAKLYGFYKYYGNLSNPDKYIDFLYHFSTEDYFTLANGDLDYHLKNPRDNFFEFFFDLIDNFCVNNNKTYWTAKIDPAFLTDRSTFSFLLTLLHKRYGQFKIIQIKRDFLPALLSAQYMEGKNFSKRRKGIHKYIHLLAYTQSWFKTYLLEQPLLRNEEILQLKFDEFIHHKKQIENEILNYIGIIDIEGHNEGVNKFAVNTSFGKARKELSAVDRTIANSYLYILKLCPKLVYIGHIVNKSILKRKPANPIYRKILKNNYFKDSFKKELKSQGAHGLLNKL